MLRKGWKDSQKKFELALTDRFDDELTIMAVEEEAPTAAGTFSSLEDLVSVHIRAQTAFDNFTVSKVFFEGLYEQSFLVERDLNIGLKVDLWHLRRRITDA